MRLSEKHKKNLIQTLSAHKLPQGTELYLFGSRASDIKKGGDIDLLLILPAQNSKSDKHSELSRLKSQSALLKTQLRYAADDQRVDLSIYDQNSINHTAFAQSLENKILLHTW